MDANNYVNFIEIVNTMQRKAEARAEKFNEHTGSGSERMKNCLVMAPSETAKARTFEKIGMAATTLVHAEVFSLDAIGTWIDHQRYTGSALRAARELRDYIFGTEEERLERQNSIINNKDNMRHG